MYDIKSSQGTGFVADQYALAEHDQPPDSLCMSELTTQI